MKCYIAKDLLPNYIDGLTSEETNIELQNHISGCTDCRTIYEKMTADVTGQIQPEDSNIDFIKKLKTSIQRKKFIVAIKTFLLVLAVLCVLSAYMFFYEIQVPYDKERTKVEITKVAILETVDEQGEQWHRWRRLDESELEKGEVIRDELSINTYNLPHYSMRVYGRNINRNGKQIRVVYYCYTQSPLISFLYNNTFYDSKSTGSYCGSALHDEDFEPKMIEVYYLPNLFKFYKSIEKLTDEEYDMKRLNGALIWNGVI